MTDPVATDVPAPHPTYRLIPSRFPPIGLFDTVATATDLAAVMELAGWTNDRLVAERLARLPQAEWVYGRPNASIVMASFLHVAPGGLRFNGGDLGAWYAAATLRTAVAEVGHHLRREAVATSLPELTRTYRAYTARLDGRYRDLRGAVPSDPPGILDPQDYAASQGFGEAVRAAGGHGLLYDSLRHAGGVNVVAYRTRSILDVTQGDHYAVTVQAAASRIEARRIATI
ncbi:RES family NAD+ phosphorylase [Methylobacterium sp. EM32]|uniref:RES family NAD+ phosphorylase n=1 Tax=Methylobacterium sp. EM32 TaxID=3163481 RepID=UPI00339FA620